MCKETDKHTYTYVYWLVNKHPICYTYILLYIVELPQLMNTIPAVYPIYGYLSYMSLQQSLSVWYVSNVRTEL